ncbi:T9SS type A sorting domain-containing protein [Aquimarina spongiae]|uniref:Por secretion system C-terminal sorting domain-containing protein n=1 Tax=Aquimarina spongiae TaxID=570521 RepID=A0A1M6F693_9FLAO|nr:T9SS type A sorting domain-containing protein [Aquimarina spongiae]SHI93182.1 Por secretion system C-terminal sorting domain-containing protein [Aquimarina spongiae]
MKTFLLCLKRSVWALSLFGMVASLQAQQVKGLKTQADQLVKGHALYKQSKVYDSKHGAKETKIQTVGDRAVDRMNYELSRLNDPSTGEIPLGIRDLEISYSKNIPVGTELKQSVNAKSSGKFRRFQYWENRGPFNVGGRTRALAIDRTNENIIFAGGVSGGLWRSSNGGETWSRVSSRRESPSITDIIQDPRPGKHRIWYYATGERLGNSAGASGAFFQGTGIYRSVNNGRSWRLLEASSDGDVRAFGPLDLINSIAIDPTNGDLYAGTITGVQRSQDDGRTFEEVLSGGFDVKAEVIATSNGQLYATLDSGSAPNEGFFTSTDGGDTWESITPEFLPATIGRTIMKADPANENAVYFFAQNVGPGGPAFLLKYDAAAASPEEAWTDLSANLPVNFGSGGGTFNLQGGYNMVLEISPGDSNLMFVGGTNLYRSTDGFTSPVAIGSWIAGYSPTNPGSFPQYTNQHPDQHTLVFFPSNPNRVLSGNDGGVALSEDITAENPGAEPVAWTDLSNGYLTTQPYHVAFDPSGNSDDLVAGFQDNGTWFTNSTDGIAPWEEDFGGDGCFSAIANEGRTRYVTAQFGTLFRFNFDEEGAFESFARVTPAGATGFPFVTQFYLDPNDERIMYLPAGNRVWRNNNLDEIPLFINANTSVNWVGLTNSDTPVGTTVSSLGLSKFPVANRLYYGTNAGQIFRMDNANLDNQPVINVSEGKGLPEGGFVNDINVDPSNADRVIVTFSNYRVISIFLTEDGGDTWTNISGNLEENPDGSGNGPSVRSTAFFGSSQGFFGSRLQRVFAATSTGLYYTNRLNGENTRWIKESFAIGNAVADEVVTRDDGFIALAVHGNGLFSARFPIFNEQPESTLSVAYLLDDLRLPENSEDVQVNVADLFVSSTGAPINIELTNSNPELVTVTQEGDVLNLSFAPDSLGQATIGLIATSGEEQVAEGFTVNVLEFAIYEQIAGQVRNYPSQNFLDFGALAQSSDDFTVPEQASWTVERILAFGGGLNSPILDNATVVIYENNGGIPGAEVYNSGQLTPISDPTDLNMNILLPEPVELTSGDYWLTVYANLAFAPNNTQWFWGAQAGGIGQETHFRDELNLFGTGATDWTPASTAFGADSLDQIFQIFGDLNDLSEPVGSETKDPEPLTTLESKFNALVWPNPSQGDFTFNLKSLNANGKISINIFDITGNLVYQQSDLDPNARFAWDASNLGSGFYFAQVSGSLNRTLKLVKR